MLNKKVGAYGEVWGEDFVLSDAWWSLSKAFSWRFFCFFGEPMGSSVYHHPYNFGHFLGQPAMVEGICIYI